MSTLSVTPAIALQTDELDWRFVRSPGPGGQNVNKVATGVQLSFDVRRSPSLPEEVRSRLLRLAGRRLTAEGVLIIQATRYRTQGRNREDALERLFSLIRQAAVTPKRRRPTRPTRASRERRLQSKRVRSATKRLRGKAPES